MESTGDGICRACGFLPGTSVLALCTLHLTVRGSGFSSHFYFIFHPLTQHYTYTYTYRQTPPHKPQTHVQLYTCRLTLRLRRTAQSNTVTPILTRNNSCTHNTNNTYILIDLQMTPTDDTHIHTPRHIHSHADRHTYHLKDTHPECCAHLTSLPSRDFFPFLSFPINLALQRTNTFLCLPPKLHV